MMVFPSTHEESLHPLMMYHMSREIVFCWYPRLLLLLLNVCPSVSSVHSHWYILLLLFLCFTFTGSIYIYSTFYLSISFLSVPVVLLLLSNFRRVLLLFLYVKESTVLLFQHMFVRLLHHQYIDYIISPIIW